MSHEHFSSCVEACNSCADACDHCASSCLAMANPSDMTRCIALDVDCAALCRLAAGYMSRGSDFAAAICLSCAEVCDACAKECAKHQMDHCKKCAEACHRCAEECRRMGANAGNRKQPAAGAHAH